MCVNAIDLPCRRSRSPRRGFVHRRRSLVRAVASVTALAVVAGWWAPALGQRHPTALESRAELIASDIYDAAQWAARLPYKVAVPLLARSRVRAFVEELDLEPAVRVRILERVDARDFVDEVVPFAIALRDVYLESEEWAPESFDAWLRRSFAATDDIPGFQHSMFSWRPPADSPGIGGAFDAGIAARLVTLYDALYLREAVPTGDASEPLICARRDSDGARAPAAARVRPVVRALFEDLRRRAPAQGEIAAAIDGVLGNESELRAVSFSIVHFIDLLVCRHYRIFATRVWREEQLARWMSGELEKEGGGRLWSHLEWAQRRRRAVLIVVDGLQGHLVESLAGVSADDPFLEQVRREQRAGAAAAPATQPSRPAPPQRTEFLQATAAGFADRRYMRFFADLYRSPAGVAEVGISTTPTISVRNLPIAQTGAAVAGPGSTSIPNFHFVDRTVEPGGRAYYFYGNDALQLETLARQAGMRTLFDRLPAVSSFSCAGQYDDGAHYRVDSLINLALGEKLRDFAELRCLAELRRRAAVEPRLAELRRRLLDKRAVLGAELGWARVLRRLGQRDERKLARKLVRDIAALEQEAMPELLVYYNPWPDHFAHFTGPFADEILAPSGELNRLDYWLGLLTGIYRDAGVLGETLFAMAGDHGLTPVFHIVQPEVEVFERIRARGIDLRVEKISSDEGEGPRLTDPSSPPSMRGLDAVVASTAGGNYMIDLFVDQAGGWSRQPLLDELRRWRPIAAGAAPIDIVDEIQRGLAESLDYLVVRVDECDADGGVVAAIAPRGGIGLRTGIGLRAGWPAMALVERRGTRIFVDDADDVLGARAVTPYEELDERQRREHAELVARCLDAARRDDRASWCEETEWRLLASYTARPDAAVQVAHLYDTDRAGTINLFPRAGIGYNTVVPGRHAGEHFHEKDAFVGVWGAPVQRRRRPRTADLGAPAATVYEYLSGASVVPGRDGWGSGAIALPREAAAGD